MNRVFFTSDLHFDHKNVIGYCNRPFKHVDDMNEQMMKNWNNIVDNGDRVYVLGDFCLSNEDRATMWASKLNGQKFFIFGNHDKALRKSEKFKKSFIWCRDLEQIEVKNAQGEAQKIILCHFAMRTWNQSHRGSWQLYGHSHGSLPDDPHSLSLDVGVDCWNFTPVSFEQIAEKMSKKQWKAIDHHKERDL